MTAKPECPECNGVMVIRRNRLTGLEFLGCAAFPRCQGTRELGCPICESPMVVRRNGRTGNAFLGCPEFPKCGGTRQIIGGEEPPPGPAPRGNRVVLDEDDPF